MIRIFNGIFQELTLFNQTKDFYFWEIADFDYEAFDYNSDKIPKICSNWDSALEFIKDGINESRKGLDIRNKALRTINEIDYEENGLEIRLKFTLHRESELWLFTRCFVNKDINESFNFDTESINNGPGEEFNKYTTTIIINKEADSNKNFISFGTYYEDKGKKLFKVFAKRQLVDYDKIASSNSNLYFYNDTQIDCCNYELYLYDFGKENIQGKIFVNNNKIPNVVASSFFIPADKRAKFMIAGIGQSTEIFNLDIRPIKVENNSSNGNGEGHCQCCAII